MQVAQFAAKTDLEIGDVVDVARIDPYGDEKFVVHEIKTIHYLRSGMVDFEFQLSLNGDVLPHFYKREHLVKQKKQSEVRK